MPARNKQSPGVDVCACQSTASEEFLTGLLARLAILAVFLAVTVGALSVL